jgi:predicted phage tail protein
VVEAGSASGSANIASLNVTGATFSFNPVPNGFYFLRVRSRNAAGVSAVSTEVMINVGNVPAPSGPPAITSVTVSSGTVTINWSAPTQGTVTSYLIEAGSATGLADLATVNTGSTALTQSFSGVPPGTYYVRIRGVNAQGVSIVSNERVITVS